MEKKRYLITNLVYGDLYYRIFTERHLRSLLDVTNLEAITKTHDVSYKIFADEETKAKLEQHPNFKRLAATVDTSITTFKWNSDQEDKFGMRYPLLYQIFLESVSYALEPKGEDEKPLPPYDYVTAWVADLVVARDFFPRILRNIEQGNHDAVFVLPLRSAFESTAQAFSQVNRAMSDYDLFKLGFQHLHPLWVACHWGEPSFTRMPYSLLWKSRTGILARSFSLTPIIFKPKQELLKTSGGIDLDVPGMFENPYWCENWTEAPVIGVEPMFCHYPTFHSEGCSIGLVRRWAHRKQSRPIHQTQVPFLKKRLYYPDKRTAKLGWWKTLKSDIVAWRIR